MESIQDERVLELKKTSVKDAIFLDLSKSNEILELENKKLKISVIGLMQKLRGGGGGGGEDFISELKEEFDLTSISAREVWTFVIGSIQVEIIKITARKK